MVALLTLLVTVLLAPPAAATPEDPSQTRRRVRKESKRFALAPDVAKIYRMADPSYRSAIPQAWATVDPEGVHPEWELELWRICRREAWCGHYGTVKVDERDGWAGAGVYVSAVADGLLSPETCPAHRLVDYTPALAAVERRVKLGRWTRRTGDRVTLQLGGLELGTRRTQDFSTRGGFGQMQARRLHLLGECVGPEAVDDPHQAATLAAWAIASCKQWEGEPGARVHRLCTCAERTRKWVGGGRWNDRTILRNTRSVSTQCGDPAAFGFLVGEAMDYIGTGGLILAAVISGRWV